jgi:hypothetical protein
MLFPVRDALRRRRGFSIVIIADFAHKKVAHYFVVSHQAS